MDFVCVFVVIRKDILFQKWPVRLGMQLNLTRGGRVPMPEPVTGKGG